MVALLEGNLQEYADLEILWQDPPNQELTPPIYYTHLDSKGDTWEFSLCFSKLINIFYPIFINCFLRNVFFFTTTYICLHLYSANIWVYLLLTNFLKMNTREVGRQMLNSYDSCFKITGNSCNKITGNSCFKITGKQQLQSDNWQQLQSADWLFRYSYHRHNKQTFFVFIITLT